jgi:hypothetical protein
LEAILSKNTLMPLGIKLIMNYICCIKFLIF